MSNPLFARSAALLDEERTTTLKVAVYGLGAVGSWASLMLNKMGVRVFGFDFDVVSEENLGPQLYSDATGKRFKERVRDPDGVKHDVHEWMPKADAMGNNPYLMGGSYLFECLRITCADPECSVHVLAMDNMEARKAVVKTAKAGDYVIDCRMGATNLYLQAFYVTTKNRKRWLASWFPQSEAEQLPCSAKATVWNATMCASHVTRYVYLHLRNEALPWHSTTGTHRMVMMEE